MLSDAENFECTVCGKCFTNTLDLSRHIEILCKFTLKNKDVIDILNSDHYDLKGATEVLLRHLSLNPVDNYRLKNVLVRHRATHRKLYEKCQKK